MFHNCSDRRPVLLTVTSLATRGLPALFQREVLFVVVELHDVSDDEVEIVGYFRCVEAFLADATRVSNDLFV